MTRLKHIKHIMNARRAAVKCFQNRSGLCLPLRNVESPKPDCWRLGELLWMLSATSKCRAFED